jgi:hypothetical protein
MREWVKCFHEGDLPEVNTVFIATAKVNHFNIRDKAKRYYNDEVHKLCGAGAGDDPFPCELCSASAQLLVNSQQIPR